MSEYQYYEFQVVDRRLSDKEMKQLRAYSTRARITPTSFVNEYEWGSFKGDPNAWMEKYFDGYLYFANWGTRELQLAFPEKVLDPKIAERYCCSEVASSREESGRVILTFFLDEDPSGDWLEPDGILSSLLQLRNEVASGDLRILYLAWLLGVQSMDETETEPPLPPNLGQPSMPQATFTELFQVDPEILAAAAKNSPRVEPEPLNEKKLSAWIESLPVQEKNEIIAGLLSGDGSRIGMELQSRFHRLRDPSPLMIAPKRRTVAELLAAAEGAHGGREC